MDLKHLFFGLILISSLCFGQSQSGSTSIGTTPGDYLYDLKTNGCGLVAIWDTARGASTYIGGTNVWMIPDLSGNGYNLTAPFPTNHPFYLNYTDDNARTFPVAQFLTGSGGTREFKCDRLAGNVFSGLNKPWAITALVSCDNTNGANYITCGYSASTNATESRIVINCLFTNATVITRNDDLSTSSGSVQAARANTGKTTNAFFYCSGFVDTSGNLRAAQNRTLSSANDLSGKGPTTLDFFTVGTLHHRSSDSSSSANFKLALLCVFTNVNTTTHSNVVNTLNTKFKTVF